MQDKPKRKTTTSSAAIMRYVKKTYKRIEIRVRKETWDALTADEQEQRKEQAKQILQK